MNSTTEGNSSCEVNDEKWAYLLLFPLPITAGLINLLVLLAATFYRKKLLRQSYVYICVTSTLLSNMLFLSLHLWEEVALYQIPKEMAAKPPSGKLELLWPLCSSAWVAMVAAVCGNLTAMIFVMLDSTTFGKSARSHRAESTSSSNSSKDNTSEVAKKRLRATILLVVTWMLPLVLTIIGTLVWNCVDTCRCSLSALGEICFDDAGGCSRVWPPLANSYMGMNIGIWFLEVIVLIYVTSTGLKAAYYNKQIMTSLRARSTNNAKSSVIDDRPVSKQSTLNDDDVFRPNRVVTFRDVIIHPRLRLVVWLSGIFVLCTILIPISFFIDLWASSLPIAGLRFSSMVLVQVYTLCCPIILLRYLSSLKNSVIRFTAAFGRCCK